MFAENGTVTHKFCTEQEAREMGKEAETTRAGISLFILDGEDAELMYRISNLKNRVDIAKTKLRSDLKLDALFDKHGLPKDFDIRSSVIGVIKELRAEDNAILDRDSRF